MIENQKHRFSLPDDLTYLNLAYMAPLLDTVEEAGLAGVIRRRNPLELGVDAMFDEVDRLRERFARLIGVSEMSRIAVTPAASYGLATAANNLPLRSGHNVVVLGDQFPSNYYIWSRRCSEADAELRVVAAPSSRERRGAQWNQRLLEAIDQNTAVVAMPAFHWSDGTRFDLPEVRRRTSELGAALVVDGTQSVGAVPFDVGELEPDALVCAAYKTLLGPFGMALAYFGPRFDDGRPLEETWSAREGSDDFTTLVAYQEAYRRHAARYDVGERSNFVTVPMATAALDAVLEWTPAGISAYCAQISASAQGRLRDRGFWVEDAQYRSPQLFGVRVPEPLDPVVCHGQLTERRIAVSLRGDCLRISPHVYNGEDDLETLTDALLDLLPG